MEIILKSKNSSKVTPSSNSIPKIIDPNSLNNADSSTLFYTIENMRKLWSKMCRLSANIFHEKYTQQIKDLYSNGNCKIILKLKIIM
jgi:hypothetical protein